MSSTTDRVHIIGIGSDGLGGLNARARELLLAADVVFGPDSTLALLPDLKAERRALPGELPSVLALLEEFFRQPRRAVLLAPGDPLFYGVARYLCDRLGKDRFEVLPHVSCMQLAFASIKESWEEAYLTNLATHPLETVLDRIRTAETVGLFTSEAQSPSHVARQLLAR